jgi:hypothetical protein
MLMTLVAIVRNFKYSHFFPPQIHARIVLQGTILLQEMLCANFVTLLKTEETGI